MEVSSIDNFSLDGVSCASVGLWCDTPPIMVLAEEKGNSYAVGRDTEMYVSDDSFKDIQFRFTAYAFFADDFDTSAVYAFLRGKGKLTMSRNAGYYWKIRTVSCTPSEKADGNRIKYQITFKCAPFRFVDNEEAVTVSSSGTLVQNAGSRYCMPQYKLTLSASSGAGWFEVDGQRVTITIPTDISSTEFTVDAERQLAYDGNNQIRTMLTAGIYPYMNIGNSYVTFGGIVQSIEITRNERCY